MLTCDLFLMDTLARIEGLLDNVRFLGTGMDYPWHYVADLKDGLVIGIVKNSKDEDFVFEYLRFNKGVKYTRLIANEDNFKCWWYLYELEDDVKNTSIAYGNPPVVVPAIMGGEFVRKWRLSEDSVGIRRLILDAYDVQQGSGGLLVYAKSFDIFVGV